MPAAARELRIRAVLLGATACVFASAAILYNEVVLGVLARGGLLAETVWHVRATELCFATVSFALGLCSFAIVRWSLPRTRRASPVVTKLMLAALAVGTPLVLAELAARPFWLARAQRTTTTIFMRDADLGWRLRPRADDVWDGVRMRINAKGLRGPEVAYEKRAGRFRVVWLGDSVTFGHGLRRYRQTFPHRVARRLERRRHVSVETVNAGVGGYSPWQERQWLATEGVKYSPDLVVVSFVLNDAVEPFDLARFGGTGEGFHLTRTASRWRLEERSALFYYLRLWLARLRYGSDVRTGAVQHETLSVRALVEQPDSKAVADAWQFTLRDLDGIVVSCREHAIPVAVVVWPFAFQLVDPAALSAPQHTVADFARTRDVPLLDLLPALRASADAHALAPAALFFDADHPSPRGTRVASKIIASFLIESHLVPGAER